MEEGDLHFYMASNKIMFHKGCSRGIYLVQISIYMRLIITFVFSANFVQQPRKKYEIVICNLLRNTK